mmetsp:Transcript_90757/g.174190  ORF Transcript_90757/g.174190 Transcript_90757/m.174190 type:complete len:368 (+) Transcript_90757:100-1203(+)
MSDAATGESGGPPEAVLPTLVEILESCSFFAALGLPEVACEPTIVKTRYKQLALRVHPDKCSADGAKEAFQRISEAFDALNTREAQAKYLRDRPKRKAHSAAKSGGSRSAPGTGRGGKAWWDTSSWDEFERRFRNREEIEAALKAQYLSRAYGKFQHRKLRKQVLSAERSCEQLDQAKDLPESDLWPPELRELPNKEELQMAPFEGAKTAWDELLERNELDDPEHCACRLVALLTHLRTVHVYCLHCGCHFEDADDLERSCPGFDEEAHENAENMAMRAPSGGSQLDGLPRELAPPPKRKRVPVPVPQEDDDDDPLNALLAAGRVAKKATRERTPGTAGRSGASAAVCSVAAGRPVSLSFGFRLQQK